MPFTNYIGSSAITQPGVVTSTTRPATPYEGQVIYETDTNRVLVYDSTAWVMIADTDQPPGLQLTGSATWTNTTSVILDGCFTSDFKNYRIIANFKGTGALNLPLVFRSGGADTGAGNYKYSSTYLIYTAGGWNVGGFTTNDNSYVEFARIQGTEEASAVLDVFGPQTNNITTFSGQNVDGLVLRVGGGLLNTTTSCDGLKITSASNTSGTVRVYGYRN